MTIVKVSPDLYEIEHDAIRWGTYEPEVTRLLPAEVEKEILRVAVDGFDGTTCVWDDHVIGWHLAPDENGYDQGAFTMFFIVHFEGEVWSICEDCGMTVLSAPPEGGWGG